jgi:hypothetical protein
MWRPLTQPPQLLTCRSFQDIPYASTLFIVLSSSLRNSTEPSLAEVVALGTAALPPPAVHWHTHPMPMANASSSNAGSQGVPSSSCSSLHTVVRSPRGDGSEGIVLAFPVRVQADGWTAALALTLGLAAAQHLRSLTWLPKDVALLFLDATCDPLQGAEVRGWWVCV